jgi:Tfp pilus assembly protein PilO
MKLIEQISRNTFVLILLAIVLIMFATTSVYGIIPQIKDVRAGFNIRDNLKSLVINKDKMDLQYEKLSQEVLEMQHELKGDMANLPENKIEAYIIGELQNISWNHEVSLIGVKPVKGENIQMFQEILFDIQLSGEYFDLFQWLLDLRDHLGFIVIKNIELNSESVTNNSSLLLMKLKVASYRRV